MRPSVVALAFFPVLAAAPAAAADMAEGHYSGETYDRPVVEERRVTVEEPAWAREEIVEDEPIVEERVIVRRSPPVVVRRSYVEERPLPGFYERRAYVRHARDHWGPPRYIGDGRW